MKRDDHLVPELFHDLNPSLAASDFHNHRTNRCQLAQVLVFAEFENAG